MAMIFAACGEEPYVDDMLRVAYVQPSDALVGESIPISIRGGGFALRIDVSYVDANGSSVDAGYRAWLSDVELTDVRRLTNEALSATVPATLPVGVHDLRVTGPWGDSTERPEAFRVDDPNDGTSSNFGG